MLKIPYPQLAASARLAPVFCMSLVPSVPPLLFDQNVSTREVFTKTVEPLLNVFAEGINVSVVLFGETDSGKSYTLTGEQSDPSAIIPLAIDYIFSKLVSACFNVQATTMWSLSLSMYEIYAEELKDLLQPSGPASTTLELGYNAQNGTFIKVQVIYVCRGIA
uniref:Kinesin motor domain-containing protein n=1 Tax=Callorhinchus milii TaxID=7868 RepID=A0A4W3HGD3_CALMI